MLEAWRLRRLLRSAAVLILLTAGGTAGQSLRPLRIEAVPVGLRPLGVDITTLGSPQKGDYRIFGAVANSGDDSVSVFELKPDLNDPQNWQETIAPIRTLQRVPAPFAVVGCGVGQLLVTSPSANSLSLVRVPEGTLVATITVGPQPYSAACYADRDGIKAVVSNLADNSLAVVDLNSLTVVTRIPDVPASRGLHGVSVVDRLAWVAGTDAHVLTLVELAAPRILARIPVRGPTAVGCCIGRSSFVTSSLDNTVIGIDFQTLQITSIVRNVPSPQDFVRSIFGEIASTGPGNSIAKIVSGDVTIIPGIPGAAGLAAWTSAGPVGTPHQPFLLVTSPDSNSLFFFQYGPRAPTEFGIGNGASFMGQSVAPGSLATSFATTGVTQDFAAGSLPLPTRLGGVTLRIGGRLEFVNSRWVYSALGAVPAPLMFVGPRQINLQVPPGISPAESVPAELERPDGAKLLGTLRVTGVAPGTFTVLMNGQGQAAVLNQDNSANFGTRPAARGTVIQIFATGAGATNPPLLAGEPALASGSPLVLTVAQPTVTMGAKTARVLFSGLAPGFVGLWQINAEVPQDVSPGPAVPMSITAGGVASNTVTIAVQ